MANFCEHNLHMWDFFYTFAPEMTQKNEMKQVI